MNRQIAYIILDTVSAFDPAAVIQVMKTCHPDVSVEPIADSTAPALGTMMLRCAGDPIVVMSMPAPLPRQEWEQASLRASAQWPEAPSVFGAHSAHLVVSTLADSSDRLHTARSIAAVVGGLLAVIPGCRGVLWESLVAHPAEFWREASRDVFAPYPGFPYPLWVSLHPFQDGGKIGVITFGLSSFIDREIELEPQNQSVPDASNKAAGLAVYLLQHGAVLKDGDTFGAAPSERIHVRHVESRRVPGLAVLHAIPEA